MPKAPKTSLQYLCNISRKTWRMNLIFCVHINVKGFFKLLLSSYLCVVRHARVTQNNKFAISLQYLKKELSDEVDFLHADKHERLLQIWFWWGWSSIPKVPKIESLQCLYNISKKRLNMKLIFCMQRSIKVPKSLFQHFGHQSFLQGWYYHY